MSNLHQKKFYSSKDVDRIINQHTQDRTTENHKCGYSEALRHIVMIWAGELLTIPKVGSEAYKQYVRDFPVSEIDIRG